MAKKAAAKPIYRFFKISKTGKVMSDKATTHVAFIDLHSSDADGNVIMFAAKNIGSATYERSLEVANESRLLGYDDWFSPDDMQAQIVIDRKRPYPMCRTDLYTGEIGWAWTSTPHPSDSSCAFGVNLGGGAVNDHDRNGSGLVLACRRVSPRELNSDFGIG